MDELIRLSKKAANEWRNTDAYYQAAVLIDSLCERLEKIENRNPQTNADRIRAMSDDKLAEFLFGFECAKEKFGTQWDCQGEALEWLRETADQDDDEDKRLPRIGRWVLLGVGGTAGPVCSVCRDKMSWFLGRATRYCPNCGARMIGGGDNA